MLVSDSDSSVLITNNVQFSSKFERRVRKVHKSHGKKFQRKGNFTGNLFRIRNAPAFCFYSIQSRNQESGLYFLRNLTKLLEFYSRLELLIQAAVFEYFARFKDSSLPHQSGELF